MRGAEGYFWHSIGTEGNEDVSSDSASSTAGDGFASFQEIHGDDGGHSPGGVEWVDSASRYGISQNGYFGRVWWSLGSSLHLMHVAANSAFKDLDCSGYNQLAADSHCFGGQVSVQNLYKLVQLSWKML
ncbi:hypothetical protein V6N12_038171 [Hibiscus sabdariffa]|uniref:Uncharacterized protein n=1 Tax=Hibiscus sabdariffa TaxID=183260 RepID=A0ABR2BX96_9ROSI